MKKIGGQVTEPLKKLLEMEKYMAETLSRDPAPGQWQLKFCDKEVRQVYEAAKWQRDRLLPLTEKRAAYWIEFSGAAVGGAAGVGDMVQKTDLALFRLMEARQNFEELQLAAEACAEILEAMKVLQVVKAIVDTTKMAPDEVRTAANLVAGKDGYNACKGCSEYIDKITPSLDKAIEIVTDLDNEMHRFFNTLTSKYTFLDYLKMYAEEVKAKRKQGAAQ
jgi:hypothetical protein